MSEVVGFSMTGDVAVVTIDSPPVNAIDRAVRAGLRHVFTELAEHPGIGAIVLMALEPALDMMLSGPPARAARRWN